MPASYKVENLDVYRRTVQICTRLYQMKFGINNSVVQEKIKERALSATLNLASGLGFWEKTWKIHHFKQSKQDLMEIYPLLELGRALGEIEEQTAEGFKSEIQDLSAMVNGLMISAKRRKDNEEYEQQ